MAVPDEFGITILKPSHQSVWSQWLLGKQTPDITPPNLRNRSWHDFPPVEVQLFLHILYACTRSLAPNTKRTTLLFFSLFQKKSPGPPFGTNIGFGLTLRERSGGSATQHQLVRSCPKVLEIRELYQHQPLTTPLKNTVDLRLKVKLLITFRVKNVYDLIFFPYFSHVLPQYVS